MEIIRHGSAAHVVRPDRVYRTGVLSPMFGFQPGVDVQATARAFTARPSGLAGLRGPGPIQRVILRIQGLIAGVKARKFMFQGPPAQPHDAAGQIAPQMQSQMSMVGAIASGRAPSDAMDLYATRRLFSYYRAY